MSISEEILSAQLAATLEVIAANGIDLPNDVKKFDVGFGTAIEFEHDGQTYYVGPANLVKK